MDYAVLSSSLIQGKPKKVKNQHVLIVPIALQNWFVDIIVYLYSKNHQGNDYKILDHGGLWLHNPRPHGYVLNYMGLNNHKEAQQ